MIISFIKIGTFTAFLTCMRFSGEPENMCGCVKTDSAKAPPLIISWAIVAALPSFLMRPADGDEYFISHIRVGCSSFTMASLKSKSECIFERSSSILYTPESMALREFSTSFSSILLGIFVNLLQ